MLLWVGARRCLSIWTKAPCGIGFAICALIVLVATSFVSVSTNRESLGSVCRKQDKNAHDRQLYHYGTTANTGDIRELRETVIRHPVLVSRAPWPSAAAYLTDIGVDPATVGTLFLTSPRAVKEMCHPLFTSQMQGKVRILSQYLSPARVAAEVGAGKGILLSAPIVQVHMRVKLMERLDKPDFQLAESLRHTSKAVANNLGVSTAYTRYFYLTYKKLLQHLVKSVAVDTALDVKEGMFGMLQMDKETLFGRVMSPEEFEMQQRVRASVPKDT
eukprot:m.428457 g.428457  ORF g.428457 m.428457 type:complete len:273 (-) comp21378_c1_seq11:496-1314(-)